MEFWAVVGEKDSRKSSTIRSLTGLTGANREWKLAVAGHIETAFVMSSAPQEQSPRLDPLGVVAEVANHPNATHFMLALRHVGGRRKNRADDYISYFMGLGWVCRGILINSPEPAPSLLATKYPSLVDFAPSMPPNYAASNAIANVVRGKWRL